MRRNADESKSRIRGKWLPCPARRAGERKIECWAILPGVAPVVGAGEVVLLLGRRDVHWLVGGADAPRRRASRPLDSEVLHAVVGGVELLPRTPPVGRNPERS